MFCSLLHQTGTLREARRLGNIKVSSDPVLGTAIDASPPLHADYSHTCTCSISLIQTKSKHIIGHEDFDLLQEGIPKVTSWHVGVWFPPCGLGVLVLL